MSNFHWNYFLTLEDDVNTLTRYIDFNSKNFETFSAEITKIYLASSSEFDVVTKKFCLQFNESGDYGKLGQRYDCLKKHMHLMKEKVFLYKYDLEFEPLSTWTNSEVPFWWTKYNGVKHNRDVHYLEGNLGNCLNSMAGLFLACLEYYSHDYRILEDGQEMETFDPKEYLSRVLPDTQLFRLSSKYYYDNLIV